MVSVRWHVAGWGVVGLMVGVWPVDEKSLPHLATAMGAPLPKKGIALWATFKSETVTIWHGTLRIIRAGGHPIWACMRVGLREWLGVWEYAQRVWVWSCGCDRVGVVVVGVVVWVWSCGCGRVDVVVWVWSCGCGRVGVVVRMCVSGLGG